MEARSYANKLGFSIAEMFTLCFCNVITFVFGLLSCIYTCKAHEDYKNGREEAFRSRSKTATILLWVGFAFFVLELLAVLIFVAGVLIPYFIHKNVHPDASIDYQYHYDFFDHDYDYDYDGLDDFDHDYDHYEHGFDFDFDDDDYDYDDDNDYYDDNDYDDRYGNRGTFERTDLKEYYAFTLNGASIRLPMAVDDLEAAGFALEPEIRTETIEAGDEEDIDFFGADGQYLGEVHLVNVLQREIPAKDGLICGMEIYNRTPQAAKLELVGGITFESSEEEVLAYFGTPGYEYRSRPVDAHWVDYFEWYPLGDNDFDRLEIDYQNGSMESVSVYYGNGMAR